MSIRLVASDLDGTLVRSDGSLAERTVAALAAAEDAGLAVVFVTGRPLRWTREVFDHVGPHGLAVVSNGAMVWDVAGDAMRSVRAIEPDVALEVTELIRTAVAGSAFAVETMSGIALEHSFMERHPIPDGARRGTIAEIVDGPVLKLLARHEELAPLDFWDRAEAVVGSLVEITWSSTSSLLEMSAAGVTKASTLALLCEEHGISAEEVLAIGDMPNDIAMLQWAGTSYAMANAHESVLAVADHVAASNDDHGVARVIEGLLGLP
ncbi:HAD family phosphatase [Nocardioides mangrovicus]|uniref:HAD family phosphatase n=1 Tax=Nocardioides mangrovicus TaxID=2478913 RepID=A0A3L8NYP3_9ACTN|nr:HAD family hydrolase [Nocardioides mangrovicus]RLV48014.1 HAD family phosphatase [Nocardioides mangrovicus]